MGSYSILQSPGGQLSHSELLAPFRDPQVVRSYALIAFATLSGVQLLGPEVGGDLDRFLHRGGILDWIVGVDAITTADALEALLVLSARYPTTCRIRTFQSNNRSLFHPKFYLFERSDGSGVLLSGSNNLTVGGLISNTEYSFREDVQEAEFLHRKQIFDQVAEIPISIQTISPDLLSNLRNIRRREIRAALSGGNSRALTNAASGEMHSRVLIRAVNRGSGRLSQVQFAVDAMTDFFEVEAGGEIVRLQELRTDGTLGPIEQRPLTFPKSIRNRRLQIRALNGRQYPKNGQWPILVFQEVDLFGLYRYVLLMPSDPGYELLEVYLKSRPERGHQTPWEIISVDEILALWPDYPI